LGQGSKIKGSRRREMEKLNMNIFTKKKKEDEEKNKSTKSQIIVIDRK